MNNIKHTLNILNDFLQNHVPDLEKILDTETEERDRLFMYRQDVYFEKEQALARNLEK